MTTIAKKQVNYTAIQEQAIRDFAEKQENGMITNTTLKELMTNPLFKDKAEKSLRAKASNMGVYKKQGKQSTNGGEIIRKAEIVSKIEAIVGFSVDTFEAASKVQLEKLLAFAQDKAA